MKIDLASQSGFPLLLDTCTLELTTSRGMGFVQEARRVADMKSVLYQPDALPDETVLYWNYKLDPSSEAGACLQKHRLTFGLVLLPPMKVGREFVKTHGHYHSSMPGSTIGYPEVYSHYFGDLYLYMQRRAGGSTASLDDCVLYPLKPGHSIMIPPGYAHILINASNGPALMGGLYSPNAVHDYGPVREMGGGAYFLIEDAGHVDGINNARYSTVPPLRHVEDPTGTRFAPPDNSHPLWQSFAADPQRYAFITDPELAKTLFMPEDQTL